MDWVTPDQTNGFTSNVLRRLKSASLSEVVWGVVLPYHVFCMAVGTAGGWDITIMIFGIGTICGVDWLVIDSRPTHMSWPAGAAGYCLDSAAKSKYKYILAKTSAARCAEDFT